jgi:hypothetical protein
MNREAIMNCGPAAVLIRHQHHMTQENGLQCAADSRINEGSGVGMHFSSGSRLLMSEARLESGRYDCIV